MLSCGGAAFPHVSIYQRHVDENAIAKIVSNSEIHKIRSLSHRVPTMCDFDPLNQHVQKLTRLVQATQSLDDMSETITNLLSEQRVIFQI